MGFFACFSSRPEADSKGPQNCDSARIFCPRNPHFFGARGRRPGGPDSTEWQGAGELLEVSARQFGIFGSRGALGHREVFAVG
jgi:hypothetical protein